MSGVRYEPCPVRSCQHHERETAVCNDCGGCLAKHCECEKRPGAIIGGGMNMLRKMIEDSGGRPTAEDLIAIGKRRA